MLKTHLQPNKLHVGLRGTNSQVSLSIKALYSSTIAALQRESLQSLL